MFDLTFHELIRKELNKIKDNQDLIDKALRVGVRTPYKKIKDLEYEVETQKIVKNMYLQTLFLNYMDEFVNYFKIHIPTYKKVRS